MSELKAIRPPAQNINARRADTTTPLAEPPARCLLCRAHRNPALPAEPDAMAGAVVQRTR
jgi:hypothetical protein